MRKLYTPKENAPMKVAVFMSGSGTNALSLLAHQHEQDCHHNGSPYEITTIFTDNVRDGNNSAKIAEQFSLPVEVHDFKETMRSIGQDPGDLSARPKYFEMVLKSLQNYGVDCIAMAGYMLLVTEPLLSAFNGRIFNVHPADLSIRDANGLAVYTGANAVRDAILDGRNELRSTTHVTISATDQGNPLIISEHIDVILPNRVTLEELKDPSNAHLLTEVVDRHQGELKRMGDWKIYPLTLNMIAKGRFALSSQGVMYLDHKPVSNGYKL